MKDSRRLVQRIFDIAAYLSERDGALVSIHYNGLTHQLRVTASHRWGQAPIVDECVELARTSDPEFTRIRIGRRLLDIVTKLDALTQQLPMPAA